jgi:NTP pyrophosphatase (non-canonical NTP hydrolase)
LLTIGGYELKTFEDYSEHRKSFAKYPNRGNSIVYPAIALAGEAGEVANEIKKFIRDDHHLLTPIRRAKIIEEMGDTLWYLDALAEEIDTTLEHVAKVNIAKLQARQAQG